MSSSGINDTGPSGPVQQQTGADAGQGQDAAAGDFKEQPVQIVSGGEQQESRPDTGSWTRSAGQAAGTDVGGRVENDGDYADSFNSPGSKTDATSSRNREGGRQQLQEALPASAGARDGRQAQYENLPRSGAGAGQSASEENLYVNLPPSSGSKQSAGRGESAYQSLKPGAGDSRQAQYESLTRPATTAGPSGSEEELYENPFPSSGSKQGAGEGESAYQSLKPGARDSRQAQYESLTRPATTAGPSGSEEDIYVNPFPSSGSKQGAGGGESAYQNLRPDSEAKGEQGIYQNLPPLDQGEYSEIQPRSLYENVEPPADEAVYSNVQQDSEAVYESIPAETEIYSEIRQQEDLYENPTLQNAAKGARKGGLLRPLQNAVKASIKSFSSGKSASRNELKTLTKNLRLVDQLRTANGQAHGTLNRLLSSNYAPEQLIASIKEEPAFLRDITEFSKSLPILADSPQAAAGIMATLELPATEQKRFAADFHAAANLLRKVYQARFDPQDANSAFRKFSNRKDNPYERRCNSPDFTEQDGSRLRNWLAYAVSYFEECSQIMADAARGEDPEIDVQELAKDIDRFVNIAPDEEIRFGRQNP